MAAFSREPAEPLLLPRSRNPLPTSTRLRTRRLPVLGYVLGLILIPSALVGASMATGWWSTTCATHAVSAEGSTGSAADNGGGTGEGSSASPAVPADVRGSMTIEQVARAFPAVTAAQILSAFGAPADTKLSTQLKSLVEDGSELDIPAFRTWLEQQLSAAPGSVGT